MINNKRETLFGNQKIITDLKVDIVSPSPKWAFGKILVLTRRRMLKRIKISTQHFTDTATTTDVWVKAEQFYH